MSGALRRLISGGRAPYEVVAASPSDLVAALVRNLAEGVGGQAAYAVPSGVVESWPVGMTGVLGSVDKAPVVGGGAVYVLGPSRWDEGARNLLRDTAVWIGTAVRLERLRADHDAADLRARRLRNELSVARTRLARVRDLERHRLVGAITTTTLRDLASVRRWLHAAELGEAQRALDELIDDFRVVVRGVFPAMLPDRGPRAALEELAATLPRPVTFTGDLGRRVGWQLESGFYHAVAASLNVLAGKDSPQPVTVAFGRDDALRARITAHCAMADLRAALADDLERVAVLGGEMVCGMVDGTAVITVRLAERIEPVTARVDLSTLERSSLFRQVRDLVRQGQSTGQNRDAWDAVAERLTQPCRVAVVGPFAAAPPGVSVVAVDAPADRALAEEFLSSSGPRGGVDAVFCLAPTPEFREALRGVLVETGSVDSLAASLVARGPVIAARRAVLSMTSLVRDLAPDHPLRWAVERVRVDAHEFAELSLLGALSRGDLLRGVSAEATRLLGSEGVDARTRLALPPGATREEVAQRAGEAASRWRAHAEHPAVGGRDRAACEVLVRTAEGLL